VNGKLQRDRTALVVVDVQEGFRRAIPDFERVAKATATLIAGAEALDVPVVITEQYPKGLGKDRTRGRRAPAGGHRSDREGRLLGGRGRGLRPGRS
jgi:nicotinamidase-related amidase